MQRTSLDGKIINPDYFVGKFHADAFLVSLTKDALGQFKPGRARVDAAVAVSDQNAAKQSLDRIQRLLRVLERAEVEVSVLSKEVALQLTDLQRQVQEDETHFKAEVRALERGSERIKTSVRDIDARVSKLGQTATRIGDRLQRADGMRVRALEAQELIAYLQAFSTAPLEEFTALPPLFTKEGTLAEAAAVSRRLSMLCGEVLAAKQRAKMVARGGAGDGASTPTPGNTGGIGSVEHAIKNLERYCNWLENRVIRRFDAAVTQHDLAAQADCVRIMGQSDRMKAIVQRWVASRPMFLDVSGEKGTEDRLLQPVMREGEVDIGAAQIRALNQMYKDLHSEVKEEVAVAKQVFDDPTMALELLIQRVYEQKVQAALERLLSPNNTLLLGLLEGANTAAAAAAAAGGGGVEAGGGGGPGGGGSSEGLEQLRTVSASAASLAASAAAATGALYQSAEQQRARLRLLGAAYHKTCKLTQNLERAVKGYQVDVVTTSDGLWPSFLGSYPGQELAWLQAAYLEETADLDSPELSLRLASKLMGFNREAVDRAVALVGPGAAPRSVRLLFHHLEAGQSEAHPGCLLEQLAKHIIGGVEFSLELCRASGMATVAGSIFRLGFTGTVTPGSASQMAATFVDDKIRRVLVAAHVAVDVVGALQAHYVAAIAPVVSQSPQEHSTAAGALLALVGAVENSVTMVLRKCVDAFITQMERVLYSEQRRSDFTPSDSDLSFDRPTPAAMMGVALLGALESAARSTLEPPNLSPFLAEVARRTHLVLLSHMSRYTYSPTGALKWKKDVAEYREALESYGIPSANESMDQLQQLVNVLVVAPESLLGLVNGTLRLSHKEALRYIALREDFKSARVEGKTLAQLFSGV